jgi:ATP-binding cassette, subfamily B, bacterial
VWRTIKGDFSIGDLTFLSGSFLRLRALLEGLLLGFSQIAGQALYPGDLGLPHAGDPGVMLIQRWSRRQLGS